eukprot:6372418-Alexandrium_andersonii.AAC.1
MGWRWLTARRILSPLALVPVGPLGLETSSSPSDPPHRLFSRLSRGVTSAPRRCKSVHPGGQ